MTNERAFILLVQTIVSSLVQRDPNRKSKTKAAKAHRKQSRVPQTHPVSQPLPFITDGEKDFDVPTIEQLDKMFENPNPAPQNPGMQYADVTGDAPETLDWTGYPT